VKLRGYRIELGEIEAVLIAQPGIKDVAAVAWQDHDGDARLVAYYVATGAPLPAATLRAALQEKLPHYMIPSRFIAMDALPLTANGKIDRKSLPTPDAVRFDVETRPVAPQGGLERQLAALWERTLNKRPIGASDNFFELGGHSLLAAQLFTRIERQLGVRLPLALLFQAPTIRQLAETIQLRDWTASWKSLVPIQPLGARPPLFVIHAAEGNVLRYRHLARRLGSDQPVYGLQSRGLDGIEPMETTIEGMAAQYLAEIRSLQANGPYYLGGYCLGGMIALETAQRLRHEGESVALLAMFETYNRRNEPLPDRGLHAIHIAQHAYYQASNLALSVSGGTLAFFAEKVKFEMSRLKVHADILRSRRLGSRTGRRPEYQHLQVRRVNERAALAYRPRPYDGVITLFKPRTHYRGFTDPAFGWHDIAGQGVRLIELPNCPRGSLNDPFVGVVADALRAEIDRTLYVPTEAAPGGPVALQRVLA
jgi:thioesterase domain-containing protein/acyl carrier protein